MISADASGIRFFASFNAATQMFHDRLIEGQLIAVVVAMHQLVLVRMPLLNEFVVAGFLGAFNENQRPMRNLFVKAL